MANQIGQKSKNIGDLKNNDWNVFSGLQVVKIGIQAPPGIEFSFNGNDATKITMSNYGIYELDLEELGYITSLDFYRFSGESSGFNTIYVDYVTQDGGASL